MSAPVRVRLPVAVTMGARPDAVTRGPGRRCDLHAAVDCRVRVGFLGYPGLEGRALGRRGSGRSTGCDRSDTEATCDSTGNPRGSEGQAGRGAAAGAWARLDESRSGQVRWRRRTRCAGSAAWTTSTSRAVVLLVGARELVHAADEPAARASGRGPRVVGDAMDLTSLGMAIAHRGGRAAHGDSWVSPAPSPGSP